MKRIQLTDEAPIWYRLWSNQAQMLAVVTFAQSALPLWEDVIPPYWFAVLAAVIGMAGIYLRGVRQPGLKRGANA